jgi:hypothetical protein
MRKALPALVVVALISGCGGGGKKTPTLTRAQYVADLDKLCTSANRQVAALKLTTAMKTWKQNGAKAAKIARQTVDGFEALKPPEELRDAAKSYNQASEDTVKGVQQSAQAAEKGDAKKFADGLTKQQNAVVKRGAAARQIGATDCA